MSSLVDSNVLIDVLSEKETWFEWSAAALARAVERGTLCINPMIYAELAGLEVMSTPASKVVGQSLPADLSVVARPVLRSRNGEAGRAKSEASREGWGLCPWFEDAATRAVTRAQDLHVHPLLPITPSSPLPLPDLRAFLVQLLSDRDAHTYQRRGLGEHVPSSCDISQSHENGGSFLCHLVPLVPVRFAPGLVAALGSDHSLRPQL